MKLLCFQDSLKAKLHRTTALELRAHIGTAETALRAAETASF
jgi:hypothetical protein